MYSFQNKLLKSSQIRMRMKIPLTGCTWTTSNYTLAFGIARWEAT